MDFYCGSAGKKFACNLVDLGSIPGFGRSSEKGKAYLFQYSALENSMDCRVGQRVGHDWVTFTFTHYINNIQTFPLYFPENAGSEEGCSH